MKCELCGQDFDIVYKTWDSNINNFRNACLTCIVERQKLLGTIYHPSIKKGLLDYNLMCALTEIDMKEKETNNDTIEGLIEHELYEANKKFPQFQSAHEGKAIIEEEIDEALDEIKQVIMFFENLWESIKKDESIDRLIIDVETIEGKAINAIEELIQVAAMCKKFRYLKKEDEKDG